MSSDLREYLETLGKTQLVIWLNLLIVPAMFVIILFADVIKVRDTNLPEIYVYLAVGVSFGLAVIALSINKFLSTDKRIIASFKNSERLQNVSTRLEEHQISTKHSKYLSLSNDDRKIAASVNYLMTPFITTLALSEGITVIGFLVALYSGNPIAVLPFFLATLFIHLSTKPKPLAQAEHAARLLSTFSASK